MVKGIERRIKRYVEVIARHTDDGAVTPLTVVWEDGRRFKVEKVLDRRQAASFKVGGNGIRYIVLIAGKRTQIFFEEGRWFVEEKVLEQQYPEWGKHPHSPTDY